MDAIAGDKPFILHPDGVGWLFVTSGLKDGPLPTHYEPLETPFGNPLYPERVYNPAADRKERPDNPYARSGDERFPYVLSTYRLTEHHTAGGMSRQLVASGRVAAGIVLRSLAGAGGRDRSGARRLGDDHHAARHHRSARAGDAAHAAAVGGRPHRASGRPAVSLGLSTELVTGDVVNDLLVISEEPNVRIMETKALLCDIEPGRRQRGPAALEQLKEQLEQRA